MKNYLNFETEIKDLENELEKLKDPYNQEGLSEVDTQKISSTQKEIDEKLLKGGKNEFSFDLPASKVKITFKLFNYRYYTLNSSVIVFFSFDSCS